MAVGDVASGILGTATTNYQPGSGVEVQITALLKEGGTDGMFLYDGTNTIVFLGATVRTYSPHGNADEPHQDFFNMGMIVDNTNYIRKAGTSEKIFYCGVQVG